MSSRAPDEKAIQLSEHITLSKCEREGRREGRRRRKGSREYLHVTNVFFTHFTLHPSIIVSTFCSPVKTPLCCDSKYLETTVSARPFHNHLYLSCFDSPHSTPLYLQLHTGGDKSSGLFCFVSVTAGQCWPMM